MRTSKDCYGLARMFGLSQFDRSLGTFTVFTKKDGLPNTPVRGIQEDGEGYLWLATETASLDFIR